MEKGVEKQILLVGACGMGVGPLGIFLSECGHSVWAYDDYPLSEIESRLAVHGIHFIEHFYDDQVFDEIILTRAVEKDAGLLERLRHSYPDAELIFRGDYLARVAEGKKVIAVVGSHGKTTTTGYLVKLFNDLGLPLSYVVGAYFQDNCIPAACCNPESDYLLLEVDESDGTIDAFTPYLSIVTSVELDHTARYHDRQAVEKAFHLLIERTSEQTFLNSRIEAHFLEHLGNNCSIVDCSIGSFRDQNYALAKQAVKWVLNIEESSHVTISGIETMPSIERRQSINNIDGNTLVIGDYAHHPSEINALLSWVEEKYPEHEVHWVFQPHRYSRTVSLKSEFVSVLAGLEPILIPEYGAFEPYDANGSSMGLVEAIRQQGRQATYCSTIHELITCLQSKAHLNRTHPRLYLFVGAGDIIHWKNWFERCWNTISGKAPTEIEEVSMGWSDFLEPVVSKTKSYLSKKEPLKRKTTLNVGGTASLYAEPGSLEVLQLCLKSAKMMGLPVRVLGKGSNALVGEKGVDAMVIRLNHHCWSGCDHLGNGRFRVGAGLSGKLLAREALKHQVSGFNFLDGIPGSIGGLVYMNAGSMGSEIGAHIVELEAVNSDGKRVIITPEYLDLQYRHCGGIESMIVVHAVLQGTLVDAVGGLEQELERFREIRRTTQPSEPSAGCMFKNPESDSAGRLIDTAGLKSFSIGGAQVSEKHANFLVTSKGATADDVEALILHVQRTVKDYHGIELEQEIRRFQT